MLKLFKKLPENTFKRKLPRILSIICDASKEETRIHAMQSMGDIGLILLARSKHIMNIG
jgi:hypothetical protein